MGIPLDDVIATFSPERQQSIATRAAEMIAEEMTLRDLRKAMGKTQVELAKQLGKPQAAVSRIESQSDLLLSTLNDVLRALGGRVRVLAEFPGRAPVLLSGFADIASDHPAKSSKATRPRKAATV